MRGTTDESMRAARERHIRAYLATPREHRLDRMWRRRTVLAISRILRGLPVAP